MLRFQFIFLFWLLANTLNAQTGVIKGRITNAINNQPIAYATVLLLGTDKGEVTDEDGNYEFNKLEPGLYNLRFSFLGFKEKIVYEISVTNNKPAVVNVKLEEYSAFLETVEVRASPFRKTEESPLSLRTIGANEIQRRPGGNRDISKVIQSLPGVATSVSFRNDLIIRGGAPNENRFYLDDVEVPNINHFSTQGASGGPVGMINVDFISEVNFFSSAFPVNRGNALSSVFNFYQRDGRDDKLGLRATLGASDIGATLEGPIGKKTTFLLSARRSYLQFLFDVLDLPFLPTYNDFQAKIKVKLDKKNEIYFVGLGAIDDFELNEDAGNSETNQYLLENIPINNQWNYTTGLVYKHYLERGYTTFVLSRNQLHNEAEKYAQNDDSDPKNLILDYESEEIENKLRLEHTHRFGGFKINGGVAYEYVEYTNATFNKIFTSSGADTVSFGSDFDMHKYALFAQLGRNFMDNRLTLSVGLRADANSYSDEMGNLLDQLSPRFAASYELSGTTALNFSTGIYYQLPPYTVMGYEENGSLLNKENGIKYIKSSHISGGFEWNTATNTIITLEGYYKKYENYPFLLRDSLTLANLGGDFGIIGNEPAVSRSAGQSYGIELLLQQRFYKGLYGIASYTLGWSEFEDKNGNEVASSWDARYLFNLTLGFRFSKNWELGFNWRLQSPLPFTPFDSDSNLVSSWDVNNEGIPDYDQLNTLRGEIFNTFDARIDKKWFFKNWNLNFYVDIQNVFGDEAAQDVLILDRPLAPDGTPIGNGMIINPGDPVDEWRYKVKTIQDLNNSVIPTLGIVIEI